MSDPELFLYKRSCSHITMQTPIKAHACNNQSKFLLQDLTPLSLSAVSAQTRSCN